MKRSTLLAACVALVLALAGAAQLQAGILTFGEEGPLAVPVNPTWYVNGVRFTFAPSNPAYDLYGAVLGFSLPDLQGQVLQGATTETLTIHFDLPTSLMQFGVALLDFGAGAAVHVNVFLNETSVGSQVLDNTNGLATQQDIYLTGLFRYTGTPIDQAVVTFSTMSPFFVVDNLSYQAPEPGTVWLLGVGLCMITAIMRRGK